MSNLGNSIKNVALLSRKDVAMLVALFIAGSLTSVIYLYRNPIYVKQLQPIMLTLSLIIFMILALNVSYIAYKVLSQANILHALMVAKREDTPLKKLIVTLIIMNFLAFANFSFIVVGFAFDANLAKIIALSLSIGTWPLFFMTLMNMDTSTITAVVEDRNYDTPIAKPCGPLIIPCKEANGC